MSSPVCSCEDSQDPRVVANPPGLSTIADRVDDFNGFRRALLQPLPNETALLGWVPAPADLGLQILEWWAYLGDILTFYNERIANESYLRTAELPGSVQGLVALLGYQPRPAIAAVGQVAAIRSNARPNEAMVIPDGLQLASIATPGVPVQTFETSEAAFSGLSDVPLTLAPRGRLVEPAGNGASGVGSVLLAGTVASLAPGDRLVAIWQSSLPIVRGAIGAVTTSVHALLAAAPRPTAIEYGSTPLRVVSTAVEADPGGGRNTRVVLKAAADGWLGKWDVDYRLLRWTQTTALWTQSTEDVITFSDIHLSAAVRGIAPGDLVFLDSGDERSTVGVVLGAHEEFRSITNPSGNTLPAIPVAHTVLTLTAGDIQSVQDQLADGAGSIAVRFGLKDAGTLVRTPATTLASLPAIVTPPSGFAVAPGGLPAFVEDPTGAGIEVTVTANGDGTLTLAATAATPATFSLDAPVRLLVDVVDVSRGATVAAESLGTGDAGVPGQSFKLKQSPLTYLARGAGYISTLRVAVDGIYWTEAATFYGQSPDAKVFVVSQLPDATSVVRFGDGMNGARLPSGGQVVASYRYGAGAAGPPAGRLTTILKPQPNLASIHNPVAVWGGADAEQPGDVRRNAPESVLTFGRAISADDYETVAALAPGVARARAYWTWDAERQRTLVKVYVGDDAGAATSARSALAGAEDPNRPVAVAQATPIPVTLSCTLLVAADRVAADVVSAATAALADPITGLFAAASMAIGQPLYTSQVEAALLVNGVTAVRSLSVDAGGSEIFTSEPVGRADPGEGSFYALAASAIAPVVDDG